MKKTNRPWWKQVLYALSFTPIILLSEVILVTIGIAMHEMLSKLTYPEFFQVIAVAMILVIGMKLFIVIGNFICEKYKKMMRHLNKESE